MREGAASAADSPVHPFLPIESIKLVVPRSQTPQLSSQLNPFSTYSPPELQGPNLIQVIGGVRLRGTGINKKWYRPQETMWTTILKVQVSWSYNERWIPRVLHESREYKSRDLIQTPRDNGFQPPPRFPMSLVGLCGQSTQKLDWFRWLWCLRDKVNSLSIWPLRTCNQIRPQILCRRLCLQLKQKPIKRNAQGSR